MQPLSNGLSCPLASKASEKYASATNLQRELESCMKGLETGEGAYKWALEKNIQLQLDYLLATFVLYFCTEGKGRDCHDNDSSRQQYCNRSFY